MRPIAWETKDVAHPEFITAFAWVGCSSVMPVEYRLIRTPGHRYELWIMGPGDRAADMKEPQDVTPLRLTVAPSAPKGKAMCEELDRLLRKALLKERRNTRKDGS